MRRSIYFLTFAVCAVAHPAHASSATWIAAPSDALWSTGSNWGGTSPGNTSAGVTATSDIATFNTVLSGDIGGSSTPIVIDSGRTTGGITFTGAAGNYVVGDMAGNPLYVSTGSMQIDASLTSTNAVETVNAPLVLTGSAYGFTNNSASGTGAGAGTLAIGGQISRSTTGTSTLTLGGSNTNANVVSGNIVNGSATTFAVTKSGLGTWALSGTNTYNGATTVNAGTLQFNGASSMSSNSALTLVNDSTVALRSDTTATFTPASIVVPGSGATTLNFDVNSVTSATNKTLTLAGGMTFAPSTVNTINITGGNGYTLGLGAINAQSGPSGPATLTLNATTANLSIASITLGSYGTNANFTGTGAISMGSFLFNSNGSSTITFGTLGSGTGPVVTLTAASNGIARLGGGNSVVLNSGTLNFNSKDAFSDYGTGHNANFTINGGVLDNTSGAALTTGYPTYGAYLAPTLAGSFAFSTSAGTTNNNLTVDATGPGVLNSASLTVTLNGAGSLSFLGVMTNTLAGDNTLTVNNGSSSTTFGSLTLGGYALSNSSTNRNDIINGSGNVTINGVISNGSTSTSGLAYGGTGVLTYAGTTANTYTGLTSVTNGELDLNKTSVIAVAGALTAGDGTGAVNTATVKWLGNSQVATTSAVTVKSDGRLDLNGKTNTVASLTATGGTIASSTAGGNLTVTAAPAFSSTGNTISSGATVTSSNAATLASGGTLAVNGTLASAISVSGTLSGSGSTGALTIQSGGKVSPGNSPGTLTSSSAIFNSGGGYIFQMNTDGSTGTAGLNWDKLALTGNLNIAALTSSGTFTLTLESLTGSNVPGLLASFDPTVNHTWTSIIIATGLTLPGGGFNSNLFTVDTSDFQNALSGGFTVVRDSGNPNNLNLVYTAIVPEPGTYALMLGGLVALVACQRRQSKS